MPDIPEPLVAHEIHPLVKFLSYLWLVPKREYLRRFRVGRTVLEKVADCDILVLPEVFNPVAFRTGKYFARVMGDLDLAAKNRHIGGIAAALDVGTGTGLLALVAAKNGFQVDAVDLNLEAVRCAQINVSLNQLESQVRVYHGDLFKPVAGNAYDLIIFSPPSFRGEPRTDFELCWRSTDVFERFASVLPASLKPDGLALVLQTSHGDEAGLLAALRATQLQIELVDRKHFGVEILSVYGLRHRKR